MCEEACSVLNGPSSCYRNCGCNAREEMLVDWRLRENLKEIIVGVLNGTDCLYLKYETCLKVGEDKVKKCILREHCEVLIDFSYLTQKIPKVLWMAISPPVLVNFIQKEQEITLKNFNLCQRGCFKEENWKENKNFIKLENCIGTCDEQFIKDFDGSCSYNCFMNCIKKGDECLEKCLDKDCGIIEGKKIEKKIDGFKLKSYGDIKEDL